MSQKAINVEETINKLEEIVDEVTDQAANEGLKPAESNVSKRGDEIWVNIWVNNTPKETLSHRRERTLEILKCSLRDPEKNQTLPTVINVNYEDAVGDKNNGIAVYWT